MDFEEPKLPNLYTDTEVTLNNYNDKDIDAFDDYAKNVADTGSYRFNLPNFYGTEKLEYRDYEDTFLNYSFFQYYDLTTIQNLMEVMELYFEKGILGKLGENLLRDMKPGVYFANRDAIDKLSVFGGIMVGLTSKPAEDIGDFFSPSRLFRLDRDIFFMAEYRGAPIGKRVGRQPLPSKSSIYIEM